MKFQPEKKFFPSVVLFTSQKGTLTELATELHSENFAVHQISKLSQMLSLLEKMKPDAFIMDLSDNEIASLEFCYAIKSNSELDKHPVIMIAENYNERREIEAFNAGADDFITKPIQMAAFIQRLRSRMKVPKDSMTFQQDKESSRLHIDKDGFAVFIDNTPLELSKKEFELLYVLASQPGKNFSREELSQKVWHEPLNNDNRTIDVHIVRLRKKLGKRFIKTLKGVGYRFTTT